jgi:hypothetical protein
MAVRVTVNSVPKTRVSINSEKRDTIRTVGIGIVPDTRLSDLTDVNASSPDNNDTLVYDTASGKYVVRELPIVNGGTF